jgi:hypothetical protein
VVGLNPRQALRLTPELNHSLEVSRRNADRLFVVGRDAFGRGLLPLRDYLEQSALAQRTELGLAEAGLGRDITSIRAAQVDRLRSVLQQLEQFQAPSARHWEADVALAKWALADAELELARVSENEPAAAALQRRRLDLAEDHQRLRDRDAAFGWASLEATSDARSLTVSSAGKQGQRRSRAAAEYRDYLTRVARQTERWSRDGAGIGRADRVERTALRPTLDNLVQSLQSGQTERSAELLDQAHQGFRQLFDRQEEFQARGTASIYDLSRTWLSWRDTQRIASAQPGVVDDAQVQERDEALSRLSRLADRTTDLRGRRAVDVSVVRLLEHVDRLEEVASRAVEPGGGYAR